MSVKTGSVIPLGDGSVGKSVIMQLLKEKSMSDEQRIAVLNDARKSKNIEMEFAMEKVMVEGTEVKASIQYYNFPGQIQKESATTVTFDEIINIFEFLPALKDAHVLLLLYDTNRIYTLKSLENWVKVAAQKGWIKPHTLVVLVSNKTDLQPPNDEFVEEVRKGIIQFITNEGVTIADNQVLSRYTSCKMNSGIDEVRSDISNWIAANGLGFGQSGSS
ncbi:MAG: hypothetical protein ACXAE3_11960 [Candidatus Kariarchaeaceae archaeon]|jgi:GTPase SAR1 family protein